MALNKHNFKHPSIQSMIQAYLGIDPKEPEEGEKEEQKPSFSEFMQSIGGLQ